MCLFKRIKISKIKSFEYHYTVGYAMYADENYKLENINEKYVATIKKRFVPPEETKVIEVDDSFEQQIEELLKQFNAGSWDGFNKSDKHVLDGNSFDLYIKMEEENRISASGYMKWPKGYKEFKKAITELFDTLIIE